MKTQPSPGAETRRTETVVPTAGITLGRGEAEATVFSTPSMILLMELAAKDLLAPHLEADEDSVGVSVAIEHLAPTPLHAEVWAVARLESVEKRQFAFTVEAFDASGCIGRGTHNRAVVRVPRFKDILRERHPACAGAPVAESPVLEAPAAPAASASSAAAVRRSDRVRLEVVDGVAHLTLNRPEKLNAIDRGMTEALEGVLDRLGAHSELRLLVIQGAGRGFCAGEDIRENAGFSPEESVRQAERRAAICDRLAALPVPVIARVHGACMGGGLVLALGADWIFATPDARFALPEIKLGWPPAYGILRLRERIGFAATRDLCLLGTQVNAQQAQRYGIVSKVTPSMSMDKEVSLLSERLLALSKVACAETRRFLRSPISEGPNLAAYARARAHPDAVAGMAAFLKRR